MRTVREKISAKFEALATEAGLELLTAGETTSPGKTDITGTWLVMDDSDGLDTRLRIRFSFDRYLAGFVLSGQAVDARDIPFFRDRGLVREPAGSSGRGRFAVPFQNVGYDDGERFAKLTAAVRDLLAPYAVALPDDPARPGESIASRHEAEAELARRKLNRHAIALVLRRAYGHGSASFALVGQGSELGYLDYDRDSGRYSLRVPGQDSPLVQAAAEAQALNEPIEVTRDGQS